MSDKEIPVTSCQCTNCHKMKRKPKIPMYAPYTKKDLVEGETYYWCSCGRSSTDPYCDRTCESENRIDKFVPIPFTIQKKQACFSICGCKYTKSPPFCDGSHATMPVNPLNAPCKCDLDDW